GGDAEVVEDGGAEIGGDAADQVDDAVDIVRDRAERLLQLAVPRAELLDVDLHDRQRLPQLVVYFAGDAYALLLLNGEQASRQLPERRVALGDLHGHVVEGGGELSDLVGAHAIAEAMSPVADAVRELARGDALRRGSHLA